MKFNNNSSSGNSGSGGSLTKGGNSSSSMTSTSNFTKPDAMGKQALLPQAQTMLQGLYRAYGLEFPDINMGDPKFKDKVVAVGKVAEVAKTNQAALKQMLTHTQTLMAGQVSLAEFYAESTKVVVAGKKLIDKATADAFLALADYQKHSTALQQHVNRKLAALDAHYNLVGELGQGKLGTAMKMVEVQKQSGHQRQELTMELATKRQALLDGASAKRKADREYIRTGHLGGDGRASLEAPQASRTAT